MFCCASCGGQIWDLQAGKEMHTLEGHRGGVLRVRFHPKEFLVASCSEDRTVRQWDVEAGKAMQHTTKVSAPGYCKALFKPTCYS